MAHYRKPLAAAVGLNTLIFAVEGIAGLEVNSLSLIMDMCFIRAGESMRWQPATLKRLHVIPRVQRVRADRKVTTWLSK